MLESWLLPVQPGDILNTPLADYQLGKRISYYAASNTNLRHTQIALVGVGAIDANAVRQELYQMAFPFEGLHVTDLGNVRRKNVDFIIPLIKELHDSRILPILISPDPHHLRAQYKAFLRWKELISLAVVDESIPLGEAGSKRKAHYLQDILYDKDGGVFHLGLVGCQTHFSPPEAFEALEQRHYDCVRLGKARTELQEVEPIIRDADVMGFHLQALKQAEAPGVASPTPSGFTVEEACQLCRYAGMSDKLKSFGLFGYRESRDLRKQTAQVAAQMIWYFIEGFHHRKNDYPVSTDGLIEYIVDFKHQEYSIVFWKSQKSGRWWMQVPGKAGKKYQRHHLVPCSYNDYRLACQEELPDRLLNAMRRLQR
jgi:formiminoglutamase